MPPVHHKEKKVHEPKSAGHRKAAAHHRRQWGLAILLVVAAAAGVFLFQVVSDNLGLEEKKIALGATFSKKYAETLGVDWKQAYTATLDDLNVRLLRIPAYWDDIEPEPGVYNFSDVDWQVAEADKRGAKIILAIGRKLPRWPECHPPQWVQGTPESLAQTKVLTMLEKTVNHFADRPAIVAWQVENEPFFDFGICPPTDREFLEREVRVVKAIDARRPVVITESGELSTWIDAVNIGDILGISTYRMVWDRFIGYFYWPVTPRYYTQRAAAVSAFFSKILITELQAEPWATGSGIAGMPVDQQIKLMNPEKLRNNVVFARRMGFDAYLWGVEWWYWLAQHGHPEMWEAGKALIRESQAAGKIKGYGVQR